MTDFQPESNYPIGNLTIAELEALIVNIVQKVLRQEKEHQQWDNQQAEGSTILKEFSDDTAVRPLSEIILETASQIPEEEWAKIPRDASLRVDDYLYGNAQEPE